MPKIINYVKNYILDLPKKLVRNIKLLKIDHQIRRKVKLKMMNSIETVEYIKKNQCSISRFGDGEFEIMFTNKSIKFQKNAEGLSKGLKKVLSEREDKKLLVCLPYAYYKHRTMKRNARHIWEYAKLNYAGNVNELLGENCKYVFGDAQVTRPWIDFQKKKRAKEIFEGLKDLWKDRDIIIVEGEQTRLGVGNDLFEETKSIKRITVPPVGAFEKYEQIKSTILKTVKNELVLLAVGPTATVLAADLSHEGLWAIDVGHIDIEYEWFLQGARKKVKIEGKFVNEVDGGESVKDIPNEKYEGQIIEMVK